MIFLDEIKMTDRPIINTSGVNIPFIEDMTIKKKIGEGTIGIFSDHFEGQFGEVYLGESKATLFACKKIKKDTWESFASEIKLLTY